MKKLSVLPLSLGCVFAASNSHAIDLKQSKLTQVVNDVKIISASTQQEKSASVNDVFSMPDVLETGIASRAELVAEDETVTRVGANTIFSFDPASRTINLKQGSLLFHSEHGKGGGTIHTGSATASVLGTTLIVTTTPSGGMKVLDLEGSVEVKFLSGLKQNLAPGNMAFVKPGGSQLSPIIIFRLDSLTSQSKLVNGFNGPLSSMPLIQQAIDKQLKALGAGQLTDTGLEVGGEPNSQGIPTIDLEPLQAALDHSFINSAKVTAAMAFDAVINQSSLTFAGIPVPPKRVFLNAPDAPFILPGNTFFTGQGFFGFAGRNISFNTIGLNPLHVDLSPYSGPEFDFVAAKKLALAGSVIFDNISVDNIDFSLIGGSQITVAPGAIIRADAADFNWATPSGLTLDNVTVENFTGNTSFGIGGDFTMQNNSHMNTYGNFSVQTPGNITVNNSTVVGDSMFLNSTLGTIGLDSTSVTVNNFGTFRAGQDVTINNSTLNAYGAIGSYSITSTAGSVNLTGGTTFNAQNLFVSAFNNVTVDSANLSNLASANLVGNTVTVSHTMFSQNGSYNFGVANGQAYVNNGVHAGAANFIQDSIGATALTSTSQLDFSAGPSAATGLHVYTHAN